METGYSLHTLRQASRRSWRIGQTKPVRVKFLAYKDTMQETCIRLMGKKMLVALMMEGKFSGEGLQSLDADEDMLTAMARELVQKGGVGETAEAVWQDLERERSKHVATSASSAETSFPEELAVPTELSVVVEPVLQPHLDLLHSAPQPKRKAGSLWPTGHVAGEQMRLFG